MILDIVIFMGVADGIDWLWLKGVLQQHGEEV